MAAPPTKEKNILYACNNTCVSVVGAGTIQNPNYPTSHQNPAKLATTTGKRKEMGNRKSRRNSSFWGMCTVHVIGFPLNLSPFSGAHSQSIQQTDRQPGGQGAASIFTKISTYLHCILCWNLDITSHRLSWQRQKSERGRDYSLGNRGSFWWRVGVEENGSGLGRRLHASQMKRMHICICHWYASYNHVALILNQKKEE